MEKTTSATTSAAGSPHHEQEEVKKLPGKKVALSPNLSPLRLFAQLR
jgi:hypothetical protein